MVDPNRALLESAVRLLGPVLDELVFLGGCATGLLLTDAAANGIRPTRDVDAIVDVSSYARYAALAERLRALGLVEDTSEGSPICRWTRGALVLDVMPTDSAILGFSNRWYPSALTSARSTEVGGHIIRTVTSAYFLATKLEAFHGRGEGDVFASHDLEDIVAVVDGRTELVDELREADVSVRSYVAIEFERLLTNPDFMEALPGFLLPDPASQARRPLLERRLRDIAGLVDPTHPLT